MAKLGGFFGKNIFIPLEEVLPNGFLLCLYLAGSLGRESRTLRSILEVKGSPVTLSIVMLMLKDVGTFRRECKSNS